jgi:hypothetical protein
MRSLQRFRLLLPLLSVVVPLLLPFLRVQRVPRVLLRRRLLRRQRI